MTDYPGAISYLIDESRTIINQASPAYQTT